MTRPVCAHCPRKVRLRVTTYEAQYRYRPGDLWAPFGAPTTLAVATRIVKIAHEVLP